MPATPTEPFLLTVSLVNYQSDRQHLRNTLSSLAEAVTRLDLTYGGVGVFLVDNGSEHQLEQLLADPGMATSFQCFQITRILSGHGNVGFGRGHNLAIAALASRYHLILNPDVLIETDAFIKAISFLDAHPEIGLLTPLVLDEGGAIQYLCRRYPSVLDLFVRGFLPVSWQQAFKTRLIHYEMCDVIDTHTIVWDPPIVSGCFMLFRTQILEQLGGFNPAYFLYFEDYDISLRAGQITRTVYFPAVCITHYGGGAARKGWRHIRLFLTSALIFFRGHGWRFF